MKHSALCAGAIGFHAADMRLLADTLLYVYAASYVAYACWRVATIAPLPIDAALYAAR